MTTPDLIVRLSERLRELPGIGPRQARRLADALVRKDRGWVKDVVETLERAQRSVRLCESCARTLFGGTGPCTICTDPTRLHGQLLIVEKDVDFETIERSGAYQGHYFVLGGSVSPLDKDPEHKIRWAALVKTVNDHVHARTGEDEPGDKLEIILALSATPDGDDTALYLREKLSTVIDAQSARISELGRGLSTGSELEYADTNTIKSALGSRKET